MHKIIPKTLFIGQYVIFLPTCQSTNTYALNLDPQEQPHLEGTVVITAHQTHGRGQRANDWQSEANQNITLSVILSPKFLAPASQFNLNMTVSLAVHQFLANYLDEGLKIKWPNDILYQKTKIGGILIENVLRQNQIEKSIVGIGLNINQTHFDYPQASSLRKITGQNFDLMPLYEALLENLENQYLRLKNNFIQNIKSDYLSHLFQFKEKRAYIHAQSQKTFWASIQGVDEHGQLILQTEQGIEHFSFKEVSFIY